MSNQTIHLKSKDTFSFRAALLLIFFIFQIFSGCSGKKPSPASLSEAVKAFDQGKYAKALNLTGDYLAKNPGARDGMEMKYKILMKMNRREDALAALNMLLKRTPSDSVLLTAKAELLEKMGRDGESLVYLEKAYREAPSNFRIVNLYADRLVRKNKLKKALSVIEKAKKRNPPSSYLKELLMLEGGAYFYEDKLGKAEEAYKELLKMDRENPVPFARLLRIYTMTDKVFEVEKSLEYFHLNESEIVSDERLNKKDRANLFQSVADVYYYRGDFVKSLEYFDKSIEAYPDYHEKMSRYIERGTVHLKMTNLDKAREDGKTWWSMNPPPPKNSFDYSDYAHGYFFIGNYKMAFKYINKAIKAVPHKAGHYGDRALFNFYLGNYDASTADFREFCKRATKDQKHHARQILKYIFKIKRLPEIERIINED